MSICMPMYIVYRNLANEGQLSDLAKGLACEFAIVFQLGPMNIAKMVNN